MKRYFLPLTIVFFITACGIKEQADQLKAFEKCTYELVSADSVYVAGTDVKKLISGKGLNLQQAPKIAFAYFQQKIPVKGTLQLKVVNPGNEEAAINQFEYKILIENIELLSGSIDKHLSIAPNGDSVIVPLKIDKDVYPILSDAANQRAINEFLTSATERKLTLQFKIKPSFILGKEIVQYPDYITVNREISNVELLNYLKSIK